MTENFVRVWHIYRFVGWRDREKYPRWRDRAIWTDDPIGHVIFDEFDPPFELSEQIDEFEDGTYRVVPGLVAKPRTTFWTHLADPRTMRIHDIADGRPRYVEPPTDEIVGFEMRTHGRAF